MPAADIAATIDTFAAEIASLGRRYVWVQAFENKGEVMGCSNPHPHGQIWAPDTLPNEAAAEEHHQRAYLAAHGTPLLVDYARHERERRVRVVHETDGWVAVVPYWAVWPFETLILPTSTSPACPTSRRRRAARSPSCCVALRAATTAVRRVVPLLDGLARRAVRRRHARPTGSCTPTSIRRCCGRRR